MGVHVVKCVCRTLVQMANVLMNGSSSVVNAHGPGLVHNAIQVSYFTDDNTFFFSFPVVVNVIVAQTNIRL